MNLRGYNAVDRDKSNCDHSQPLAIRVKTDGFPTTTLSRSCTSRENVDGNIHVQKRGERGQAEKTRPGSYRQRQSSTSEFRIAYPKSEFREACFKVYQDKAEAIGALFETDGEFSDYVLFNPSINTLYPMLKGIVPQVEELQQGLECFWLPMQRDEFLSLNKYTRYNSSESIMDHLRGLYSTERRASGMTGSSTLSDESPSEDSFLDEVFNLSSKSQPESDHGSPHNPVAVDDNHFVSPELLAFQAEEMAQFKGRHIACRTVKRVQYRNLTNTTVDCRVTDNGKCTSSEQPLTGGKLMGHTNNEKEGISIDCRYESTDRRWMVDADIVPLTQSWSRDRDTSGHYSFKPTTVIGEYENLRGRGKGRTSGANEITMDGSEHVLFGQFHWDAAQQGRKDSGYSESIEPTLKATESTVQNTTHHAKSAIAVNWNIEHCKASLPETAGISKELLLGCIDPLTSLGLRCKENEVGTARLPAINDQELSWRLVQRVSFDHFETDNSFNPSFYSSLSAHQCMRPSLALSENFSDGGESVLTEPAICHPRRTFSQTETEVDGEFGEPLMRYARQKGDQTVCEDRYWRDFMLYG